MTLTIPCKRRFWAPGDIARWCEEGSLCPYCGAIRILRATCSGVAERLEEISGDGPSFVSQRLDPQIGRLRADVARVEGRTE